MLKPENLEESELMIYELLKEVMDPELCVNIIDLGLVYSIVVRERPVTVDIQLTFTTKNCPMGDAIIQEIERTLYSHYPGVIINTELVWEPEWNSSFITEEGHIALSVG